MDKESLDKATRLFQQAYRRQMDGKLDEAVRLYQESLRCHPTAEAHTFLGWSYSFQGRYEDAIEECQKAIAVDPDFGNPYNDIGAYLIQLGRPDEAIPWLEKATRAPRYEARHYPYSNLGRVYLEKGMLKKALEEFEKSLALDPDYAFAQEAIQAIRRQLQ